MIDLHAHILPGVDDGPASLEEAVELARAAVDAGTRVLAATSHVSHMFATDPRVFPARLAEVREALRDAGVGLEVVPGGELAPSRVADLDDEALRELSLGGGPYLLVECPFSPVSAELEPLVYDAPAARAGASSWPTRSARRPSTAHRSASRGWSTAARSSRSRPAR